MFLKVLAACAFAAGAANVAPAAAQDNPANSPAGSGAETSCRDFIIMDSAAQTNVVKQLAGANDADVSNTDKDAGDDGNAAKPTSGDYSLNSVVAACRNAPSYTVGDAIAKGSGGTSQGSTGTSGKSEQ
jgi:hypothetical protein